MYVATLNLIIYMAVEIAISDMAELGVPKKYGERLYFDAGDTKKNGIKSFRNLVIL